MTIDHYGFITAFIFVICCGGYPYYRARLKPVQGPKRETHSRSRADIEKRIHDASAGMSRHTMHSQFYKMHNDNKIKAMAELLKLENEKD